MRSHQQPKLNHLCQMTLREFAGVEVQHLGKFAWPPGAQRRQREDRITRNSLAGPRVNTIDDPPHFSIERLPIVGQPLPDRTAFPVRTPDPPPFVQLARET